MSGNWLFGRWRYVGVVLLGRWRYVGVVDCLEGVVGCSESGRLFASSNRQSRSKSLLRCVSLLVVSKFISVLMLIRFAKLYSTL